MERLRSNYGASVPETERESNAVEEIDRESIVGNGVRVYLLPL